MRAAPASLVLLVMIASCSGTADARRDAGDLGPLDGGVSFVDGGAYDAGIESQLDGGEPPDAGTEPRDGGNDPVDGGAPAKAPWVTAYYASWMAETLPIAEVDFSAITHLAHFGWLPRATDGVLEPQWGLTEAQTTAVVAAAHAGQRKVLLVIGGASTRDGFLTAIADHRVDGFVAEIVAKVVSSGYDGVDLDMEPLENADAAPYGRFVTKLRTALDQAGSGLQLTTAVGWNGTVLAPLLARFDQVNLMTYDLAGAWPGWETWHNTPLHNGGLRLQSSGTTLPSIESLVDEALATGATRERLGIGISFYGYVWRGANGPNQPIAGVTVDMNKSYDWIMENFYDPSAERWHSGVEAPYLSITHSGARDKFVSYENERSIAAKLAWVKAQGLGGVIVWELGGGWRSAQPVGQRDPLLQAVKAAAQP